MSATLTKTAIQFPQTVQFNTYTVKRPAVELSDEQFLLLFNLAFPKTANAEIISIERRGSKIYAKLKLETEKLMRDEWDVSLGEQFQFPEASRDEFKEGNHDMMSQLLLSWGFLSEEEDILE
jgi:hypothetical protein